MQQYPIKQDIQLIQYHNRPSFLLLQKLIQHFLVIHLHTLLILLSYHQSSLNLHLSIHQLVEFQKYLHLSFQQFAERLLLCDFVLSNKLLKLFLNHRYYFRCFLWFHLQNYYLFDCRLLHLRCHFCFENQLDFRFLHYFVK